MKIGIVTNCPRVYKTCMANIEASPNNRFWKITSLNDAETMLFDRVVLGPDLINVKDSDKIIAYVQMLNIPIRHAN